MDKTEPDFGWSDNRKSSARGRSASGGKIQTLKWAGLLAVLVLLVGFVGMAEAQQPKKVYRIGYMGNSANAEKHRIEALLQGLRELGWTEGQNIVIEYRWAEGKFDQLSKFAAELVHLQVDIIFAPASLHVEAARKQTSTIPIVFALHGDPLGAGHVASLARPGGNITGLAQLQAEQNSKALEVLREAMPGVTRIAVLWNPGAPAHRSIIKAVEATGRDLGLRLQTIPVDSAGEFDKAFETISRERVRVALVLQAPVFFGGRQRLADLALRHRLPTMFGWSEFVEAGGLMSYGPDSIYMYRRAATYVDKILKGTKPADLPVERPSKFELVINLKTAKQIGLTVPPNVLTRADRVIR